MPARKSKARSPETGPAADQAPVYLVHGTDEFAILEEARRWLKHAVREPDQPDALETVPGDVNNGEEVQQAVGRVISGLRSLSMFTTEKVVWLRGANFLPEKQLSKSEAAKTALDRLEAELRGGLGDGVRLLITSADKVSARSSFFKTLSEVGAHTVFSPPDKPWEAEASALALARNALADRKVKADPEAVKLLIDRAGHDHRQLVNEAEKLDLYLGRRRTLTEADVLTMVPAVREVIPYEFYDAVSRRDLPQALRLLDAILDQNRNLGVMLMTGLARRFRELSAYRAALDNGWARLGGQTKFIQIQWQNEQGKALTHQALVDVRKTTPYAEGRLADFSRKFTAEELAQGRRLIVRAHELLFVSSLPPRLQVEFLVIQLILGRRHEEKVHGVI